MNAKKIEERMLKQAEKLLRSNLTAAELVLVKVFAAEIKRLRDEVEHAQSLASTARTLALVAGTERRSR